MRRRTARPAVVTPGLRGEVAAGIHERYTDIWRRQGGEGAAPASWVGRAARIEAGEAVLVASWELPHEHPAYSSGTSWYTLERGGSLTEEAQR
jgi:hypothetical protein